MRMVDADALKEKITELIPKWDKKTEYGAGRINSYEFVNKVIDNAPTVETYTKDDMTREYLKGYNACKDMRGEDK